MYTNCIYSTEILVDIRLNELLLAESIYLNLSEWKTTGLLNQWTLEIREDPKMSGREFISGSGWAPKNISRGFGSRRILKNWPFLKKILTREFKITYIYRVYSYYFSWRCVRTRKCRIESDFWKYFTIGGDSQNFTKIFRDSKNVEWLTFPTRKFKISLALISNVIFWLKFF